MRKLTSKEVALSGVSAALAIVFIVGAIYIPVAAVTFYVLSALSISLPLIKRHIVSSILSYVAAALIAFFVGHIKMLPFVFFYGLYAIITWLLDFYFYEKCTFKPWIKITIIVVAKLAYFALMFWALVALMSLTLTSFEVFNITWTWPTLIFSALIIFILYDIIYREVFKLIKRLLERRIN